MYHTVNIMDKTECKNKKLGLNQRKLNSFLTNLLEEKLNKNLNIRDKKDLLLKLKLIYSKLQKH